MKKFSTKAPQYYADGAVYPIGKPTLNEEGYWGESYNFEVSAAYVKMCIRDRAWYVRAIQRNSSKSM